MFTGIVEEIGQYYRSVRHVAPHSSRSCTIQAAKVVSGCDRHLGDSIAVNGVCLTATSFIPAAGFTADVMHETPAPLRPRPPSAPASRVNLERAMAANGRFGGHIVAGHVDGVGTVQRDPTKTTTPSWYTIAAGAGPPTSMSSKKAPSPSTASA